MPIKWGISMGGKVMWHLHGWKSHVTSPWVEKSCDISMGGKVMWHLHGWKSHVTSSWVENRLVKLGLNFYSVCQPHQFPNISQAECTIYASGQSTSTHVIYSFEGGHHGWLQQGSNTTKSEKLTWLWLATQIAQLRECIASEIVYWRMCWTFFGWGLGFNSSLWNFLKPFPEYFPLIIAVR